MLLYMYDFYNACVYAGFVMCGCMCMCEFCNVRVYVYVWFF